MQHPNIRRFVDSERLLDSQNDMLLIWFPVVHFCKETHVLLRVYMGSPVGYRHLCTSIQNEQISDTI